VTDPWWWAAIGGAVGAGGIGREIVRAVARALRQPRKSDAEIKDDLRDALVEEIARLRGRVDRLEERADTLHQELQACEERSAVITRENELLREHADALAVRVGQLEGRT